MVGRDYDTLQIDHFRAQEAEGSLFNYYYFFLFLFFSFFFGEKILSEGMNETHTPRRQILHFLSLLTNFLFQLFFCSFFFLILFLTSLPIFSFSVFAGPLLLEFFFLYYQCTSIYSFFLEVSS